MPRRKGHGIPPTKRIKTVQNALAKTTQKSSKGTEKDCGSIQVSKTASGKFGAQVVSKNINGSGGSSSSDAEGGNSNSENNYLHKKFKKVAATAASGNHFANVNGVETENSKRPKEDEIQDESKVPSGGRYMCPYCKLACAKPSVLEKHIRAHTNERPYPCVPCGFAFKTKSNLYKHCRSRAHAVKVGEADTDEPGKCQDVTAEHSGSDANDDDADHEVQAQARLNASPLSSSQVPPHSLDQKSFVSVSREKKTDDRLSKSIYKPKFHTTSLYLENSLQSSSDAHVLSMPVSSVAIKEADKTKSTATSKPTDSLQLKMPPVDRASLSDHSSSSPFTSSSPSPEFLQRHISKLISDNQAIVETMDPIWPKKFLHRSNSKDVSHPPSSPFSTATADSVLSFKKNSEIISSLPNYTPMSENSSEHDLNSHSKLALALLRPQDHLEHSCRSSSPLDTSTDQQPLNLTTSYNKSGQTGISSRKRCYSEGFPYGLTESELPSQSSGKTIKHPASSSIRGVTGVPNILSDLNNVAEKFSKRPAFTGSVMKDFLLKSNIPVTAVVDSVPNINSTSNSFREKSYSPENRFVCQFCSAPCQNFQVLEIHQIYYCKANEGTAVNAKILTESVHSKMSHFEEKREMPVMITPPFPSPGPLLGNTPLVDSYIKPIGELKNDEKSPMKKMKHDSSGSLIKGDSKTLAITTLRSLEELSKLPMKNSLQMFGGEVKILDNSSGEPKTLRIEPLNKGSQGTSEVPLEISSASEYNDKFNNNDTGGTKEKTPQMVVTIAKSGFHSGGTIQVPYQPPNSQDSSQQRCSKSVSQDSSSLQVSPPHISNSKYPSSNNLIIPIIPNIVGPNLSVAGIPSPVQLPLAPFTPLIAEKSILNPLTSITGYNPLTLPPASLLCPSTDSVSPSLSAIPPPYRGGIVTILHGGKAIPYVPGMPGPHTLLQSTPILPSPTGEPPRINKVVEQMKPSESNDLKTQRTPSVHIPPSTNDGMKGPIPSIKLDSGDIQNSKLAEEKSSSSTAKTLHTRRNTVSPKSPSISSVSEKSTESLEEETDMKIASEKRFLRPTSLPLKPGTFTPKKLSTPNNVLPLVSPETPRPRKSYGQLYLNGHAYTYLGLKCSTRVFFCTLNKPQPIYVPLSPEHSNISMYSNWKIRSDADPNPFGLDPGQAMAHYDSRHRPSSFTIALTTKFEAITHSSQWEIRSSNNRTSKIDSPCKTDSPEDKDAPLSSKETVVPKRIKIFDGGFESNEDYIYVRGRGRGRYVCEECGIRCKKPSMLKKHIRTHTDVRPFTCKHCNFSFKTKGNLTKHMKSKAHYKKCTELGIDPVPTTVDDSHINAELLAKQQAMRADQGLDPNETDEDEDGEEDEDEDEEDEDDDGDEIDEEEEEDYEDEWNSRLEQDAARSLLSLSKVTTALQTAAVQAGLMAIHGRPHTYPYSHPHPSVSEAQVEQPQTPTLTAMSAQREREKVSQNTGLARVHPDEPPAQLERSEPGVASRYYFPSTRNFQEENPKPSPESSLNDSANNNEVETDKNAMSSIPMDLSNKTADDSRARTCEAALLLASLCSTVDSLPSTPTPITDVAEDSQLLQAYLTERAVKQQSMKQHQYHRPQATAALFIANQSSEPKSFPNDSSFADKLISIQPTLDKLKFHSSTKSPNFHVESLIRTTSVTESKLQSNTTQDGESDKDQHASVLARKSDAKELAREHSDPIDDAKKSQLSPSSDAPPSKKPKAEFMPPSSGPPPNYVSVLEDGRSMCLICNKLFTKPSQLWLHVNIHYFERPFRCESCAVSFRTKGHLQKHQRSVTHMNKMSMNSTFGTATTSNPRPFKCDDCKIAFRIHGHLAKHLRSKMHIMKLECLGKLPFGTYAEMERSGINMNDIDTTDCDNSLESLQLLAQKLIEKDPSKLGQWDPLIQRSMSTGETSSDEEDSPAAIKKPPSSILHSGSMNICPRLKGNVELPTAYNSSSSVSSSSDSFALPKTDSTKTVIQRGAHAFYGEPNRSDESSSPLSGNISRLSAPVPAEASFPAAGPGLAIGEPRTAANSVLVPVGRNYPQQLERVTTKLLMNSNQLPDRTRDSTVVSAIRAKVDTNSDKKCS